MRNTGTGFVVLSHHSLVVVFVGSFVGYAVCDFSQSTSQILMKSGTDVQHHKRKISFFFLGEVKVKIQGQNLSTENLQIATASPRCNKLAVILAAICDFQKIKTATCRS